MGKSSQQTSNKSNGRKQEKATHTPMLKVFKDFMTQKETEHTNKDQSSLNQEKVRDNNEKATYVKEKRKKRRQKSYEQKSLESVAKVKQKRPSPGQAYDNAAYNDHCDHHYAYQGAGGMAGGDTPNRLQSTHKYKPLPEKRESWWMWSDRQPSKTGHKRDKGYSSTGSGVSCQFKKIFCNEYAGAMWLIIMFACTVLGAFFYAFKILWMQPPSDQLYSNPYIGITPLGSQQEILITPPRRRQEFRGHRRNSFGDVSFQNNDMAALHESYLSGAGDAGYISIEKYLEQANSQNNPVQSSFHPSYGLSNILDQKRFNDRNLSPKIKNFYKRLLETDEQIQILKKGIFENSPQLTNNQKTKLSPYESMYRLKRSLFHNKKKEKLKERNSPKIETTTSVERNTLLVNESGKKKGKDKPKSRKRWRIFGPRKGKVENLKGDKRVKRFPNGTEILDIIDKGVNLLVGVIDKPKFKKCSHKEGQGNTDDDKSRESKHKLLIPIQEKIPEEYEERIEYNKNKAKELSKALLNNFTSPKPQDTNFDSVPKNLATKKPYKSDAIKSGRKLLSFNEIENSELEAVESFEYPEEMDSLVQAYSDYGVLKDKGPKVGADEEKTVNSTTEDLARKKRTPNAWFDHFHDSENNLDSLDVGLMSTMRPDILNVTDDATEQYTDFLNFVRKHLKLLSTKKTEENKGKRKRADMDSLENIKTKSIKTGSRRKRDIIDNFGNTTAISLDNCTQTKDINQVNMIIKEKASANKKNYKNKEAEDNRLNENGNYRSRKLLSKEEDNFNISDKNQQDSSESKTFGGNSSIEHNSTASVPTITVTVSGQEANSTSENKAVVLVKRSAGDSGFMFRNDIYDEDYGIKIYMDDNKPNKRSDELKKPGNWIQDKTRKMTDSLKKKSRDDLNKFYDLKREKRTEEAGPNDDNGRFAQVGESNNADDFDLLMDHMKQVCELASKAVRETRNLKREDEESEMTSGLMQNMVKMLSELVDFQVQQKTCLTLSPDLRGFLDWLTLPQTFQAPSKPKDKHATKGAMTASMPEEEAIIDLASTHPSEKEDHSDVRSECLGTLQAVQSLIDEYALLSEEDKSSMVGVKEYLEGQLNYLNKQLDNINEVRNTDANSQALMQYRYRKNSLPNPNYKYETQFHSSGLPQNRRIKRKYTRITQNNFESTVSTENNKKRSVDRNYLISEATRHKNFKIYNQKENKENSNDVAVAKDNTFKRNLKDVYYLAINEAKKTSPKSSSAKRLHTNHEE